MGRFTVSFGLILVLAGLAAAADDVRRQEDEAAIRKAVQSYADAYNRGDAAAVAAHWSRDGAYVADSGERFKGPDKMRPALERFLSENKGIRMTVAVFDVQVQASAGAVAKGIATLSRQRGEPDELLFTAAYVKESGAWKLLSVEEEESTVPFSTIAQLGQLEWLIGEWVDQDEDATVETTFRWTNNYGFISGSFRVIVQGRLDAEGTQVIGWDPVSRKIRSWVFDDKGGFGEGEWTSDGNRWTVKLKNVLGSGQKASSINVYTYVDPNTFSWHSTGREVDGEPLPNIDEVIVVRKEARSTTSDSGK